MSRPRYAALAFALVALAGCRATTHPRYAPELESRWPDCQRIVVFSGTVQTEIKNFKTDDWFLRSDTGGHYGQLLAQSVARVLRDQADREPRVAAEAAAAL